MAAFTLNINGRDQIVEVPPEMPLLRALRDVLGLTGTKYGCGMQQCGACTVPIDGEARTSCRTSVGSIGASKITTIEGISLDGLHAVQAAWIAEDVPQCGYCQTGQIMAATGVLAKNPNPTDDDIEREMARNICRCGTYDRIRRAIHRAAGSIES